MCVFSSNSNCFVADVNHLCIQGGPEGLGLGYVDLDVGSSLGWWADTIATYCPSRMMEHLKSKSTQPRSETF